MKVLVMSRYGTLAASTRQRFMQYKEFLQRHGVELELLPLMGNDHVASIGAHGSSARLSMIGPYVRRARQLLGRKDHQLVWVASELFPYLPGFFERIIRWRRVPYVVDYDDAIFHLYDLNPRRFVRWLLSRKLAPLLKGAAACTCGNRYLQSYARRFCPASELVPTVVDTDIYVPRTTVQAGSALVVGWLGSPTTWKNVEPLVPTILATLRKFGASFHVVGAGPEAAGIEGVTAVKWSEAAEVAELQRMDIGIMPLLDRPFQRGKCGYKLIQYMACGVPVIASPVGVNREIVESSGSGLLAGTKAEWAEALEQLLADAALRREFGLGGRQAAVDRYSLASQAQRILNIMKSAIETSPPPRGTKQ